jgi:invasion protein IalB
MKRWGMFALVAVLGAAGVFAGFGLDPGVPVSETADRPVTSPSTLRQSGAAPAQSIAQVERREANARAAGEAQVAINRAPASRSVAPAAIPQPLAEVYGNWRVRCALDLQSNETCHAEQVLSDSSGRPQLALMVHGGNGTRPARMDILPPWGILIEAGVVVQIEGGVSLRAPVIACLPAGCQATLDMSEQVLASLRNATHLQMHVVSDEGQILTTRIPLAGFGDAYGRLSRPR